MQPCDFATLPIPRSSLVARLDHLPAVAGGITETGVDGTVALHRLLRELHPFREHAFAGGAAVLDDEHQRRHRAFGHERLQGVGRRRVVHRRARLGQPELERRLFRMLHCDPVVLPLPRTSLGLRPVMSRKVRPKVPMLLQPVAMAMSVIERSDSRSNVVAPSMRRVSR